MKKVLRVLSCCLLLFSCAENEKVEPIEKYKGVIVLEEPNSENFAEYLMVKNKDSVFEIIVPAFDAKILKAGDTIK
jgi:hypothetical protein